MDIRRGHGTTQTKEIYRKKEFGIEPVLKKRFLQNKIPPNTLFILVLAWRLHAPGYFLEQKNATNNEQSRGRHKLLTALEKS